VSLIERSVAFAEAAKDLDGLKKAANLVNAVGTRAQMFEAALANLRLASGQLALLRDHDVTVEADVSSAAGFIHYLTALKTSTADDPSAVTTSDVGQKTLTPLRAFTTSLSEACITAWRAHVNAKLPRVGADLLPVLAQVPALKARVERFRSLLASARGQADALPTGPADFDALEQTAQACHAAWQALDAEGIPANVTRFLRGATSDAGAGLDSLTDEVSAWLETHNISASFTIRARA
jgi:hypothetical protein